MIFFDTSKCDILSLADSRLIESDQILKQHFADTSCFDGNGDLSGNLFRKNRRLIDPKERARKSVLDVI